MQTIADVVRGREVYVVEAETTALQATEYMVARNIGAVGVVRNGELVGIFTERDLLKRVVAGHRNPGTTEVCEVMTPRPKSVSPDESWENCLVLMREHNFRHLPVMQGGKLIGLISVRDLIERHMADSDDENRMMRSYIAGQ